MTHAPVPRLARVLGLAEVTAGGIGIIIGAGIYVLIGPATAAAGAGVWLAFALAAGLSLLTALSYMELASMFPSAAAEYEYTRRALPEWFAFGVGWLMISGLVVAAATIALGFASYLRYFLEVDATVAALCLIGVVSTIAAVGVQRSVRLSMLLSAIQVGGLVFVIVVGIEHVGEVDLLQGVSLGGVTGAAALVFFAFIGFDEVITLAEETREPTRTVPRALILALTLSTLLYVGVAIASVSVLGVAQLSTSERPLADVIGHGLGGSGAGVMAVLALISTTNTTMLAVTAGSRLMYGMARAGTLPAALGQVNRWSRTPVNAIILTAAVASLFAVMGDLTLAAHVTDFTVFLVFLAVNASLVILRFKQPLVRRPFHVPLSVRGVPLLPLLGFATVAVLIAHLRADAIALGLLLLLGGVVIRRLGQLRSAKPDAN